MFEFSRPNTNKCFKQLDDHNEGVEGEISLSSTITSSIANGIIHIKGKSQKGLLCIEKRLVISFHIANYRICILEDTGIEKEGQIRLVDGRDEAEVGFCTF